MADTQNDTRNDTWRTPHLQGLLAPVFEERDDADLEVIGELPAGLNGMFVRNGPNPQFAPLGAYHPFDGDGMVHAVYLEDGAARYRNRWIVSKGLEAERARGRACFGGMGNMGGSDPEVLAEVGFLKNTANTHTVLHGGRYFGLLEAGPPTELTRELDTVGEYDFGGRLRGPMTAHPKIDPVTGNLVFFGYSAVPPYLRYHEVDRRGELVHSVDLDLPAPVMMHDFVMSEHHAIFFDSPAVFDFDTAADGGSPLGWKPENGTRIGVIPRMGTADDIRWFDTDNCYVVHFFNAFESNAFESKAFESKAFESKAFESTAFENTAFKSGGATIEVTAPRMPDMPGGFEFVDPGAAREPMPWRWTIDLASGTVTDEQIDDLAGEFPRINDHRAGLRNRFAYNCMQRTWALEFDFHGVVKYDHETDASVTRYYGDTQTSGEHVFAPDPDGTHEDDGWLLGFVTDKGTEESELVILDAHDVAGEPVARVKMRARVPLGFHANWFPD